MSDLRVAKGGVDSLPPASVQQFLKAAKEKGRDLPGLVITEHKVGSCSWLFVGSNASYSFDFSYGTASHLFLDAILYVRPFVMP